MPGPDKVKLVFLRFIFSRIFWKNLGIAVIIGLIILLALIIFLRSYTAYKDEIILPDFVGQNITDINDSTTYQNFEFSIIDSVYSDISRGGEIIRQSPSAGLTVKPGRKIYLTIVASTPEKVIMPDLKYLTVRHAINLIMQAKLEVGKLDYTPNFAKNAVLGQFYLGDTIHPGDTLDVKSVIDLLVGSGEGKIDIPVPSLLGLSRNEAIAELTASSFNLGREFYLDSVKNEHARVYLQDPMYNTEKLWFAGDSINLWYRSDENIDFEAYVQYVTDSLSADTLDQETLNMDTLQMEVGK